MANKEELVQTVKAIVKHWRDGQLDEAYAGYRDLFSRPDFAEHRPEDQRSALKLMIMAKGAPNPERPTPAMVEAHRTAVPPLTDLVSALGDPADHEMLGICHVLLGNLEAARAIFRAGLAIERQRNPQSDLCGSLMKRFSLI
ncbi:MULTISPECIES: hypothetical protein [Polyangium]|uniref:Tetratricopeptide repeat protein n=2 Tax=Polyangium TaxID=55 RepID=A0A4U1J924_9BACT|nr:MULTISPECIES: hypothetical protein [Polyangium]MDI1430056.1 hypothetical protein [Polyangium sorediatum]TKD04455.1 hypothetical protein E8A74_22860 [Polyangium fumosum]